MDVKNTPVVELKNLRVQFKMDEGMLEAVNGVSLKISRGKILGIVGESGCGKTVMSKAIMGLISPPGKVSGEISLFVSNGKDLPEPINITALKRNGKQICSIRGRDISMIFQEPMAAFSPIHTIGSQMMENILLHKTKNKKEAKKLAVEMLRKVGISNPEQRFGEYVHQLSGGMRQRAMIAMALSCSPSLLIADEPTTALDVTIQAQVLELMRNIQQESGMAILYITHDLGVIAEICDEVAVMYLGKVVEKADVLSLFTKPLHPYTCALLRSIPKVEDKSRARLCAIPGSVPVPINLPTQCPFFERCDRMTLGLCDKASPELVEVSEGHWVSCFCCKESSAVNANCTAMEESTDERK